MANSDVSRRGFLAGGAAGAAALVPLLDPAAAEATERRATSAARRRSRPAGRVRTPEPAATGLPNPRAVLARAARPEQLGVLDAAALLQAGFVSSRELVDACQARIAARNGPISFDGSPSEINAWVRLYPDLAAELASAADARLATARRRRRGPSAPALCGVPLALKDLYAVAGRPLTASSRVLDGNVATGDSAAWSRLKANGMPLLGHTHTDEFAFLAVTPQCGNPWDTSRITGGSSGGSAAALAARMTPAALGSDTLGSLRIPAAFCGVSSIKPTFGLVSSAGVIPLAWALDHCGPMARSVGDCALLLDALAGADPADPSTDVAAAAAPPRYPTQPRVGARPLAGVRLGVPTNLGTPDPGPGEILARTVSELTSLGATLVELTVPPDPFGTLGPIQFYTDALAYHAQWYPSRAASYKPPAAQMLTLIDGQRLSAVQYLDLHRRRAAFQEEWRATLAAARLDGVVMLASLSDPPRRSDPTLASPATNGENGKLLTFIFSYLGFPVVTVPGGRSNAGGLPVGIQIGGAPFTEATLIRIAVDLQAHFPHHDESPA